MLQPALQKNDRRAYFLIITFSIIVFVVVSVLSRYRLAPHVDFDVHIFARINAVINSMVTILLLLGLYLVKQKKFVQHKRVMLTAMVLSVLFLVSYIAHHLLAPETHYGGAGSMKYVYYVILSTHIFLAGVILPFILFTAYRSLIGEYDKHKKLARYTWPIWLYVSTTGVIVYFMISPYYEYTLLAFRH